MCRRDRIRPGLNIFDETGNELEWDYEHDTRFYEEPRKTPELEKERTASPKECATVEISLGKRKIKTRGRGAKRFKALDDSFSGSGSLAADREVYEISKRSSQRTGSEEWEREEDESDWSGDRDPSPTPQPWDVKANVYSRITAPKSRARK
ncbi:unnamed protein product [Gongylonema pulchrum]|uniref:Adrenocorticotropic hormone n=1 Tax=Gongylonema pulchrum TaxID=637853 RepID=A0A183DWY3_9BILA|nr:unnamed protein product [Gongylonema pulchrum]